MKTRSPYTEILYSLSPSTNVTESLLNFGVNEKSTEAIAVRILPGNCNDHTEFVDNLKSALKCEIVDFSFESLTANSDLDAIKLLYKTSTDSSRFIGEICTTIATKNI